MKLRRILSTKLMALTLVAAMGFSCTAMAEEEGTGTSEEPITLTFMGWNPDIQQFDRLMEEWNKVNPNIKVEYSRVDFADHIQNLKIKMASGEGPDIFALQTGSYMVEFNEFSQDLAPLAEQTWGEDWKDMWLPYTLDYIQGNLDSIYGLPMGAGYAGHIWADKYYFDKYGLELPTNYEELLEVCQVFRDNGEMPLMIGARDDYINLDMWMSIANDISPDALYGALEGTASFTSEELQQSFQIWQNLFHDGIFQDGAVGVGVNDIGNNFVVDGKYPMLCIGAWNINSYKSADPGVFDMFNNQPEHPHEVFTIDWNMDGEAAPVTSSVDNTICINKNSENLEAAWEFVSWYVDKGQDLLIDEYLQYYPAKADASFNGEISDEGRANLEKLIEMGENHTAGYREIPYPDLRQAICDQLKALAVDEATPEEAAAIIEEASQNQER